MPSIAELKISMLNLHEDILQEFASFTTTTEDLPVYYKAGLRDRRIWSWDPPPPTTPSHVLGGLVNAARTSQPFTDGVRIYLSQNQAAKALGRSKVWVQDRLRSGYFLRLPVPPPKPSAGR